MASPSALEFVPSTIWIPWASFTSDGLAAVGTTFVDASLGVPPPMMLPMRSTARFAVSYTIGWQELHGKRTKCYSNSGIASRGKCSLDNASLGVLSLQQRCLCVDGAIMLCMCAAWVLLVGCIGQGIVQGLKDSSWAWWHSLLQTLQCLLTCSFNQCKELRPTHTLNSILGK
ncbi:hypothetical protein AK812_SmicGene43843 [Symbiodinium microadriaticum]|uniref:Uncharacterized protein n=1 Tax=Symbiodinium microadriaticum TaxID=2951 RepID=A0A1Q9BZZ6_SYMMI|nr:hypothetical protein AK812_SmicGene43843 [Symbiodinium microadriaticum]